MEQPDKNIILPDDIFGKKKQIEQASEKRPRRPPEKEPDNKCDGFLKSFFTALEDLCAGILNRFKKYDKAVGPVVSVAIHIIALFCIGGAIIMKAPEEKNEIAVDIKKVEFNDYNTKLPEIKEEVKQKKDDFKFEPDQPDVKEKFQNYTGKSAAGQSNSGGGRGEGIAGTGGLGDLGVSSNMDLSMMTLKRSGSPLKMPAFFSARAGDGRAEAIKNYGGSSKTEEAVIRALKWLASQQKADGSWGAVAEHKPTLTSLAILALLSHGETPQSEEYGNVILAGLKKLVEYSKSKGIENCDKGFGHAILAYALAEASCITGIPEVTEAMNARCKVLVQGMNKFGSYNYLYDNSPQKLEKDPKTGKFRTDVLQGEPKCDLSFAGWNYQALRAAYLGGANVEGLNDALQKSLEALLNVHQAEGGGFSYGINCGKYPAEPEMAPVGLLCVNLFGAGDSKASRKAVDYLEKYNKGSLLECKWDQAQRFPLYTWYYQTQALFHAESGTGKTWKTWNSKLSKVLVTRQQKDGSWLSPTAGKNTGGYGENIALFKDRSDLAVYCTSFCTLMLEVYYRYLPSFRGAAIATGKVAQGDDAIPGLQILTEAVPDKNKKDVKTEPSIRMKEIRIGRLNCKPATPLDKLQKDEFSIWKSPEQTVRVEKEKDFPQILAPGQRIAFFMDERIPENFKGNIHIGAGIVYQKPKPVKASKTKQPPPPKKEKEEAEPEGPVQPDKAVEVVFNDNPLWRHALNNERSAISAVIPLTYIKEGGNILEIRNSGKLPLAFDFFKVEPYRIHTPVNIVIEDLDLLPPASRAFFRKGMINLEFAKNKEAEADTDIEEEKQPEDAVSEKDEDVKEAAKEGSSADLQKMLSTVAKVKKSFKTLKETYPEQDEILSKLAFRLIRCVKTGTEITIRINGYADKKFFGDIAAACKGVAAFWIIPGADVELAETYSGILKASYPESSVIIENSKDSGQNTAFKLGYYDEHKELINSLAKNISDLSKNKEKDYSSTDFQPTEAWGIFNYKEGMNHGVEFQKKYMNITPLQLTEWLWSGGSSVVIRDTTTSGRFFDIVNKTEKLSFAGLKRMDKLAQGSCKLEFNLLPEMREEILGDVYWAGVLHTPMTATLHIVSKSKENKEVEITCPLPWYGKTNVEEISGYVPDSCPVKDVLRIKTKTNSIEIPQSGISAMNGKGLFKYKLSINGCTTICLSKSDAQVPKRPEDFLAEEKPEDIKFESKTPMVTNKRPDSMQIRTALRAPNGVVMAENSNYKIKYVEAAKGEIDAISNVVPFEGKSLLIEISYPKEKTEGPDGAKLFFGAGPKKPPQEFSFWVYPKADKRSKRTNVTLKFYYEEHFYSTNLKTEKWQRIIVPCDKESPPYWKELCIVGDRTLTQYENEQSVSFEFNDFAVYGKEHTKKGAGGLEWARVMFTAKDTLSFIFLGKPGTYAEYRYYHKNPIEIEETVIEELKELEIGFKINKNAHMLETNFNFPDSVETADLSNLLNYDEKKLVEEKGLVPFIFYVTAKNTADTTPAKTKHNEKPAKIKYQKTKL